MWCTVIVSCSLTFRRPLDEGRSFTYFCGGGGKGIDGGWYQDVRTVRVRFKYADLFFSFAPKENTKVSDRCSRGTSTHELARASRKRCVPDAGQTKNIRSHHRKRERKLLNSHSQLTRSRVEVPVWLYLKTLNTLMIGLACVSSR